MMRAIFITLLCLTFPVGMIAQVPEEDLATLKNTEASRNDRREALSALLARLHGVALDPVLEAMSNAELLNDVLDPGQCKQPGTLENQLMARPEFVRRLAAWFSDADRSLRFRAIALSQSSTWPWLLRRRLGAFLGERDSAVKDAHLGVMRGALKLEEIVAILKSRRFTEAEKKALFKLGLARAPLTQRVAAWPGRRDWKERGFSNKRLDQDSRLLTKKRVSFNAPVARNATSILLGLKSKISAQPGRVTVSLGKTELASLPVGRKPGLIEIHEIPLQNTRNLIGQEVVLELSQSLVGTLSFSACVALEGYDERANRTLAEVVFDKSHRGVGLRASDLPTGGIRVSEEVGQLAVKIPAFKGRARIVELDHFVLGPESAVWDVMLNGKPLVRLLSQAMPRAGKSSPPGIVLGPGEHRLIFTRVSGGDLYLEALRFVR